MIEKSIKSAVYSALEDIGIVQFKKTSLFLSNEREKTQSKKAA